MAPTAKVAELESPVTLYVQLDELPCRIEARKELVSPIWSISTVIDVPDKVALELDVPTVLVAPIWSIVNVSPVPVWVI